MQLLNFQNISLEFKPALFLGIMVLFGHSIGLPPFILGTTGCPMAHCDRQLTDNINLKTPTGNVQQLFHRNELQSEQSGSGPGLGCSSNGTIAACTYRGARNTLVVYNYFGQRLWTSSDSLDGSAFTSAPIISEDNQIIAADSIHLIRFNPDSTVAWKKKHKGGMPISPILTETGFIVLATRGGPFQVYNLSDGSLVGVYTIKDELDSTYETVNTPASVGNRIYISTQEKSSPSLESKGMLVALDIVPTDSSEPIKMAWKFPFGGPSGASPLVSEGVVYFDGSGETPDEHDNPTAFAIKDKGTSYEKVWSKKIAAKMQASFAKDPRGGAWLFPSRKNYLLRLDLSNGNTLDSIVLNTVMNEQGNFLPSSAMSIATSDNGPVMIVTATSIAIPNTSTWIIGVYLKPGIDNLYKLAWKVKVSERPLDVSFGQFPIISGVNGSRVVFSTRNDGAHFIGHTDQNTSINPIRLPKSGVNLPLQNKIYLQIPSQSDFHFDQLGRKMSIDSKPKINEGL